MGWERRRTVRGNRRRETLKPTVVLADDHTGVRESVSQLIKQEFEILATAVNGLQAVAEAIRVRPNVVVLDICMPEMDGLDAARAIRHAGLNSKILFLTVDLDADHVEEGFEAGANGFVLKDRMCVELIPAMRAALAGLTCVSRVDEKPPIG
jgi:DNA-binding NarL/FixJ family response regulator